jgi:hypothetical protein
VGRPPAGWFHPSPCLATTVPTDLGPSTWTRRVCGTVVKRTFLTPSIISTSKDQFVSYPGIRQNSGAHWNPGEFRYIPPRSALCGRGAL